MNMQHDFAAGDLPSLAHSKLGTPSAQYVYRSTTGEPLLLACRFEGDGKASKTFRAYDPTSGQWAAPQVRPLYRLDEIAKADPNTPIILVEGEKCADALVALGYLVTTTFGGANGWRKADLAPLANRYVAIWPDYDAPGRAYAKGLADTLRKGHGTTAAIVEITPERLSELSAKPDTLRKGWDVADAIAEGWTPAQIEALLGLKLDDFLIGKSTELLSEKTKQSLSEISLAKRPKQTDETSELLGGLTLWHSPAKEPYVSVSLNGHLEHYPLASKTVRQFLSYRHFKRVGKSPSATTLDDQCRTLQGLALYEGETHPVFHWIAAIGRNLYLDLGGDDWRAVAITAQGWEVINHSPARSCRAGATQALPEPMRDDGSAGIECLRSFLNVANDDDFRMIVAWLIGCLHPRGPYPILILSGEQGSAKSTTAELLRSLIDPAAPASRSMPMSEQVLVIAARGNHILSFDNLSGIRPTMADALCKIATGGGFGTRKLHTDSDEVLFDATRPILLNGIPDLASRPDLADRAICVTLASIPSSERRPLAQIKHEFEKSAPYILATLLDAVAMALANIDSVKLTDAPRMADFAKWVHSAAPALGWPERAFLDSYAANRARSASDAVADSPVGLAILQLVEKVGEWRGTATELGKTLRTHFPELTDDPQGFPRQANKLSAMIRRLAPPLLAQGVEVSQIREGATGQRVILIKRTHN